MGKLHELLAVEGDLKSKAVRSMNASIGLFTKGAQKLFGETRVYQPLEEGGEEFAPQVTIIGATVEEELGSFAESYGRWLDAAIQKEITNQETAANVVLEDAGMVIFTGLPATALLNLESRLADIRSVYAAIPVNDPSIRWFWDDDNERFVSEERVTYRTEKQQAPRVLYEATKEHPAQVDIVSRDVRVGTWTTTVQSGMITPRDKRERLERIDQLILAVKQARQRANDIDASNKHLADVLFAYINGK